MRSSLPKYFALTVLLVMAAFAAAHAAPVALSHPIFPIDADCSCCPQTCGGGTFLGCYDLSTPPGAVTCVYKDAAGNVFDCVSCILDRADPTAATLNAIFAPDPAAATVAQ